MTPPARLSVRGRAPRTGRCGPGFTLIELVVAVAIAAALLATVPLALARLHATAEYRATVRELLAGLREAREAAALSGQPVVFAVDLDARRFGPNDRLQGEIPDELEVRLVVAERELRSGRAAIRFYPDGSATGGSIDLLRPSGDGLRLRVDWLFGRVSQEPLQT